MQVRLDVKRRREPASSPVSTVMFAGTVNGAVLEHVLVSMPSAMTYA